MTLDAPSYDAAQLDRIQKNPLIIAVAGHANHGKTSTVRTLCRMPEWGEVSDLAGTTKNVAGVKFKIAGKTFMVIFDTPGFQYSSTAIEECGDQFTIEDIRHLFQTRQALVEDSRALEQVLRSHVVLYVIDGSCAPTERLQDDFRILARSGIPVIPVLNFTMPGTSEEYKAWIAFLHRHNYHLEVKYDAHYYRPEYERDLYDKLSVLLTNPLHREFFSWYVAKRTNDERNMAANAISAIGEMLVDCATYKYTVAGVDPHNKADVERSAVDHFEKQIAAREQQAFENMVAAYKFKPDLLENTAGSADRESLWKHDLFGKEIQRHVGIGLAAGAAAGAVLGGTIDLFVGGASFFAGTVLGSVGGAIAGAFGAGLYNNNFDRKSQTISIQCSEKMRRALIDRSLLLLKSLQHRGMADQRDFVVSDKALRGAANEINSVQAELAGIANRPGLSLIGVDPANIGKQALKERANRITTIDGLIGVLASKVEGPAERL